MGSNTMFSPFSKPDGRRPGRPTGRHDGGPSSARTLRGSWPEFRSSRRAYAPRRPAEGAALGSADARAAESSDFSRSQVPRIR